MDEATAAVALAMADEKLASMLAEILSDVKRLAEQQRRTLQALNRYRDMVNHLRAGCPDEVVADFLADTELEYADVIVAADSEANRG